MLAFAQERGDRRVVDQPGGADDNINFVVYSFMVDEPLLGDRFHLLSEGLDVRQCERFQESVTRLVGASTVSVPRCRSGEPVRTVGRLHPTPKLVEMIFFMRSVLLPSFAFICSMEN